MHCVTGSIAAVEAPAVARELMRHGAEVHVVMSKGAQDIIHSNLMEWATGNPVTTKLTGKLEHVELAGDWPGKADLILVAPASANTISKIASGIDDTPVTTVVSTGLGSKIPILIAPAMHFSLFDHPIVKEHIDNLRMLGVEFIEPRREEGKAKIATAEEIASVAIRALGPKDMTDLKLLITAGPTREFLDPIRVMSNKSSGKMGVALAQEAMSRGAEVTLIYGPGSAKPPPKAKVVNVETTQEMYDSALKELKTDSFDMFLAAAAAVDYAPERRGGKIPSKEMKELNLPLKATPKIIDEVKKVSPKTILVAFKAEYGVPDEELIQEGYRRLQSANADLIVVNDVARPNCGFEVDTNEVFIIDSRKNVTHVPLAPKRDVARRILDVALKLVRR